ncbi:hypothetical protein Aco03nite_045680 [Actinoplanes couchii]|uniref:DUF5666 domain-containing protein n=2 Tax=Actinoplanes couchii TaxID=403638 RepID=A0ABQ3XCF2_9ACTN|nr:hypothetical protein Aco03nite_045680 [Actinoplanes couchii]
MDRLGGSIEQPSNAIIADDLTRAHRARSRRRTNRIAAGSAFGVVALAAALTLGTALPGSTRQDSPAAVAHSAGTLKLVAFQGEQPRLFTIDTVPQGFFVQGQNEYELVLAPESAKNAAPGSELADPAFYTGKIAVYLQNKEYMVDPTGDRSFTIDGKAAALRTVPGENGTVQVFVVQASTVYLTVQFAGSVGLTEDQMIEIAGGINLTPQAIAEAEAANKELNARPFPTK